MSFGPSVIISRSIHVAANGFFFFHGWVVFHCIYVPHLYSFICHWTFVSTSSVQSLSHVQLIATPWTVAHQAFLSITNSQNLLKLMSLASVMSSNHLTLCFTLSSPAFSLSQHQGLFQWVGSLIRWPKFWNFSFSISPSNEYSVLISFMTDWLDLLAVQETLKSLLQHHSSKASILRCSAFL